MIAGVHAEGWTALWTQSQRRRVLHGHAQCHLVVTTLFEAGHDCWGARGRADGIVDAIAKAASASWSCAVSSSSSTVGHKNLFLCNLNGIFVSNYIF